MPTPKTSSSGSEGEDTSIWNFLWNQNPSEILYSARVVFPHLHRIKNADHWFRIVRIARHPGTMWEIDFVRPSPQLKQLNEMIRQSEKIFCPDKDRAQVRQNIEANPDLEIIFHTMRAYLRADEGDFVSAMRIWMDIHDNWLSKVYFLRKSATLAQLYKIFLCTNQVDLAISCFDKHWALLASTKRSDRFIGGLWDNHTAITLLHWAFNAFVPEIKEAHIRNLGITEQQLEGHKRKGLMPFFSEDIQWLVHICGKEYYDHARTLMPSLPGYDESTFRCNELSEEVRTKTTYQKTYLQAIDNLENIEPIQLQQAAFDVFFDERNYYDGSTMLQPFLDTCEISYESVIDLGCGTSLSSFEVFKSKQLTSIDISQVAVDYWKDKKREVIHSSAEDFLKTSDNFDLCYCGDMLDCNKDSENLIKLCAKKCQYLCVVVDLDDEVIYTSDRVALDLSRYPRTKNQWIEIISQYFTILQQEDRFIEISEYINKNCLLLLGESKYRS